MITITDILWLSILITVVAVWWQGQGVKSFALRQVKKYCDENNIQLLDESLIIKRLWLARGATGSVQLKRTFQFEFTSTGEHRYLGFIVLIGWKVVQLESQPHHIS
ncbi:DUF3301 domain-containing protein [Reinekea marina]|uniref:DUF3301 domain-containing protein n=1 Tax=Reinekea marina TaxID=1310421 RepID=A0ABV7WUH4_9GAMM|nr:DUF3301 domain-containing protein [Reinekea marina]MBU2862872.1 DUF3301 domain-containing protein [Reinekea forsetii]MDN3649130.1 DUF3301 domain-containing protein [Reinekea marina]